MGINYIKKNKNITGDKPFFYIQLNKTPQKILFFKEYFFIIYAYKICTFKVINYKNKNAKLK